MREFVPQNRLLPLCGQIGVDIDIVGAVIVWQHHALHRGRQGQKSHKVHSLFLPSDRLDDSDSLSNVVRRSIGGELEQHPAFGAVF